MRSPIVRGSGVTTSTASPVATVPGPTTSAQNRRGRPGTWSPAGRGRRPPRPRGSGGGARPRGRCRGRRVPARWRPPPPASPPRRPSARSSRCPRRRGRRGGRPRARRPARGAPSGRCPRAPWRWPRRYRSRPALASHSQSGSPPPALSGAASALGAATYQGFKCVGAPFYRAHRGTQTAAVPRFDGMLPPLVRRCPDCGHLAWSSRFEGVDEDRVERPACGHRFETVWDPRLP